MLELLLQRKVTAVWDLATGQNKQKMEWGACLGLWRYAGGRQKGNWLLVHWKSHLYLLLAEDFGFCYQLTDAFRHTEVFCRKSDKFWPLWTNFMFRGDRQVRSNRRHWMKPPSTKPNWDLEKLKHHFIHLRDLVLPYLIWRDRATLNLSKIPQRSLRDFNYLKLIQ